MIQSGNFINQPTEREAESKYYAVFENGIETEYIENGKYFVKSKLDFKSPCEYSVTVIAVTIPNSGIKIGNKTEMIIESTSTVDNLIKLKTKINDEWEYFIIVKVK